MLTGALFYLKSVSLVMLALRGAVVVWQSGFQNFKLGEGIALSLSAIPYQLFHCLVPKELASFCGPLGSPPFCARDPESRVILTEGQPSWSKHKMWPLFFLFSPYAPYTVQLSVPAPGAGDC